ncbi:hypothetical protein RMSM_02796 [Rhodopirellula maiorica SM1]|uniref:Uncharacterized protein n=1 Tax=Rhodopirellula maiorica SM1 TaxID=1265738 RepID=M5S2A2_9BACT|nr:hypothetical protein RMSM_02796 [Rhodopirellula maiorica SM1]
MIHTAANTTTITIITTPNVMGAVRERRSNMLMAIEDYAANP